MADAKIVLGATDSTKGAFDSVLGRLDKLQVSALSVTGTLQALGVTISAGYFAELVKGSIDGADHLNDLSKSTSIAVEDLAGLKLLAQQSGTDLDGLAKGINRLTVEIGKSPDKFKDLGVTAKDGVGALKQVADIFNQLTDTSQRNALANAVFGKSWAELAPVLSEGSQKIGETIEKGARLSGITTEMAQASDEFNDKLAELTGTHGLMNRQVSTLLPLLNTLAGDLVDLQDKSAGADTGGFHPLAETLRAVIVLGGNVSFVFKGIGNDIGAIAAQADALAHGNLAGAIDIGNAAKEDAKQARDEFDKWEAKITSVGTALKSTGAAWQSAFGAMADGQNTKELQKQQAAAAARAKAFLDSQNAANTAFDAINKRVGERLASQQAELAAGRELTDQEKFAAKTTADLALVKKTLTAAERANIEGKLTASNQLAQDLVQQREAIAAHNALADSLYSETANLQQQLLAQRDANAEIGLSALAVAQLSAARLNDLATSLDRRAAVLDEIDWTGKLGDALRTQAQAYRDLGTDKVTAATKNQLVAGRDMLDQIQFETSLLTLNDRERDQAVASRELERMGIVKGTQAWDDYHTAILAATGHKSDVAQFTDVWKSVDGAAHDAFVNIGRGGTDTFKQLGQALETSVLDELYQLTVKKWIVNIGASISDSLTGGGGSSLLSALGGLGGASDTFAPTGQSFADALASGVIALHSGGIVGREATFTRAVDPSVFHGARKYHTGGLVEGEVPAILKRGEGVFTPEQMKALGGSGGAGRPAVTIVNNNTIGDVASMAQVQEQLRASERRSLAALRRSSAYGGSLV